MNEPSLDDQILLQRVAQGDEEALLMLHQRYASLVYSIALYVLHDPQMAEEVTQDVFMKIWRRHQQYDGQRGAFRSWLAGVARFAAIDRLRYERRRPAVPLEPVQYREHDADADWERHHELRSLLETLPPEQQEVITLAYFGGMTHSDLAEHLSLPLGTVKSRLRLGLQKLRALWFEDA